MNEICKGSYLPPKADGGCQHCPSTMQPSPKGTLKKHYIVDNPKCSGSFSNTKGFKAFCPECRKPFHCPNNKIPNHWPPGKHPNNLAGRVDRFNLRMDTDPTRKALPPRPYIRPK